ncbi:hypothetical protein [Verrucosispora sp. WMMC514]|uniref:hypothetical protein n=1 Tax=Verrucosispora sp. WMMC514 TaxID=3015156 RepID=UPI00248BEE5F|nr:hypothetical protein [Verrucosispora sp. WMMC514]WBB94110.1 hypothetical protein O7597_14775 [Verrucosispora sp. WMMC514]
MTTTTDLELLPACGRHGTMALRPLDRQTPEQRWCGVWYDCTDPWCRTATLLPSPELRRQLAEQAEAAAAREGAIRIDMSRSVTT